VGGVTIAASDSVGTACSACGRGPLVQFADLGEIPVLCGVHYASRAEALDSPVGRMALGYCPDCAYVRNLAFDPAVIRYDPSMDTNLHHSPAFQAFSAQLVTHLAEAYPLRGATVLDVGCGQGEFLRELCHQAGCLGYGYDAMYAGEPGPDPSGAHFTTGYAPVHDPTALPRFDLVTSRHWFEHLDDPYTFLAQLRERVGSATGYGYLEVPDAGYDLATAGWEVIYPHVSYFDRMALRRIATRAGWQVLAEGTLFHGMFRFIEFGCGVPVGSPTADQGEPPAAADLDRQLASIAGFAQRQRAERDRWTGTVARLAEQGADPVLWGAGSRGVQFLNLADPDGALAAVVDVNPRKWGRYLPVTAHRVSAPESLRHIRPQAVVITNPAYQEEIAKQLAELDLSPDLLVA
jgi:methyltransferase family protein/C-methyltransferase-like protein